MVIRFPVIVSVIGAVVFFAYTVKLRHFKVSENRQHPALISHGKSGNERL
jgi:hypothetical protein